MSVKEEEEEVMHFSLAEVEVCFFHLASPRCGDVIVSRGEQNESM